jgi:hypothetical protein
MFPFRSETLKSPQFILVLVNNLLLPIGMLLFGWSFFATLFLYWLEPLAALVVLLYLDIFIPKKYDLPTRQKQQQKKRLLLLGGYVGVVSFITLLIIIHISNIPGWEITTNLGTTLAHLPFQMWEDSLVLLTLLFLSMFLLPIFLLEKQGVIPQKDRLPLPSQLLIYPLQFLLNYLWIVLLLVCYTLLTTNGVALIFILTTFKLVSDGLIYLKLDFEHF